MLGKTLKNHNATLPFLDRMLRHRKQGTSFWDEVGRVGRLGLEWKMGDQAPQVAVPSLGPERASQVESRLRLHPPALGVLGSPCQQTQWVQGLWKDRGHNVQQNGFQLQ